MAEKSAKITQSCEAGLVHGKCPKCGGDLGGVLLFLAYGTGYGFVERHKFLCPKCEAELEVNFSWAVVGAEVSEADHDKQ